VIGSLIWWVGVERRRSETYVSGGLCGLLTASVTGLLWTGWFVTVWGVEMLSAEIVTVLVAFVLGTITVAGGIAGLVFTYLRRRLGVELGGAATPGS